MPARGLRIINEPTAAALAYGHQMQKLEGTIMVYDLGGGIDVILDVEVDKSSAERITSRCAPPPVTPPVATTDQRIIDWMAEEFKKETGIDLRNDRRALQRLRKPRRRLRSALQRNHHAGLAALHYQRRGREI